MWRNLLWLVLFIILTSALFGLGMYWGSWYEIISQIVLLMWGVLLALWYDSLGNPKLIIEVDDPSPVFDTSASGGQGRLRHLYLRVTNRPRSLPLVRRKAAVNCCGTVTVLTYNTREIVFEKMPLRWSDTPEPIRWEIDNNKTYYSADPFLMRISRSITIPVDKTERIDTVMRFENDNQAIGWTDESYLYVDRRREQPKYRISDPGDYILRIQIDTDDQESICVQEFILRNPLDFHGFQLERR